MSVFRNVEVRVAEGHMLPVLQALHKDGCVLPADILRLVNPDNVESGGILLVDTDGKVHDISCSNGLDLLYISSEVLLREWVSSAVEWWEQDQAQGFARVFAVATLWLAEILAGCPADQYVTIQCEAGHSAKDLFLRGLVDGLGLVMGTSLEAPYNRHDPYTSLHIHGNIVEASPVDFIVKDYTQLLVPTEVVRRVYDRACTGRWARVKRKRERGVHQ